MARLWPLCWVRASAWLAVAVSSADYAVMPSDDTAVPRLSLHRCIVCSSDHAPFGFDTRTGTVWTCQGHRDAGEAVLAAPMRGGLGRQSGGEQR